jgi:hypothetical protein
VQGVGEGQGKRTCYTDAAIDWLRKEGLKLKGGFDGGMLLGGRLRVLRRPMRNFTPRREFLS